MNIDLIAGYFVGKVDKKFADKDNNYYNNILIPARFISPYDLHMQGSNHILNLKEKLDINWPIIEGKIRYLLSLYYNKDYLTVRKLKLLPNVHKIVNGDIQYIAIDYEMETAKDEINV